MNIKCDKLQYLAPCQFYENRELYLEGATKIISLGAQARTSEVDVLQGELRVKYHLTIKAIYLTDDGMIEVKEDGAEQVNTIRSIGGVPSSALIDTDVIGVECHGTSKLKVRVMLEQRGVVVSSEEFNAQDDDDLIYKRASLNQLSVAPLRQVESVISDKIECRKQIGKILSSSANLVVKNVSQATDICEISGEAILHINHLYGGDVCGEVLAVPFKLELAEEGVTDHSKLKVLVKPLSLTLTTAESDGGTDIEVELLVCTSGYRLDSEEVFYPIDAYSKTKELLLKKGEAIIPVEGCNIKMEERFSEVIPFENITNADSILSLGVPWVGASSFTLSPNATVQGIVCLEMLIKLEDGSIDRVVTEVPFSVAIRDKVECSDNIGLSVSVLNIGARLRYGSSVEISGELKISLDGQLEKVITYLAEAEELGERLKNDSVISVYLVGEGESLFDCAKALRSDEEELLALNPDLTLPLKAGDKVLLYHQL